MSIFKVNPTDFQSVTVTTQPSRYYSSSSNGITGSLRIFARKTEIEKDIIEDDPSTPLNEGSTFFNDWNALKNKSLLTNIFDSVEGLLTASNKTPLSTRKQKTLEVVRFTPTSYFSTTTLKKLAIKNNLSHYYRTQFPSAHWGYSNYHSLNFFSSSTVPTSSVLLYPNSDDGKMPKIYHPGRYAFSGAFSFDFYINPRYRTLDSAGHFKAGTIFHLSSSYALSLITGSEKDINGLPSAFRLQLQLSTSADISPSLASPFNSSSGRTPRNLTFLSDDNALKWNHWHHVVVRWGTNSVNHGTGSFNVDGIDKGTFVIPSSSVAIKTNYRIAPAALCIGNYYDGKNDAIGIAAQYNFFQRAVVYEGASPYQLPSPGNNFNTDIDVPSISGVPVFKFEHPLQAEVHDLSIKRFYMSDLDIKASSSTGISNFNDVCFYVPPFFTMDSPVKYDSAYSPNVAASANRVVGVPYTLSQAGSGFTSTPFNTSLAFGADGHYINTENFLKDFASSFSGSNNFPRQYFLSASLVPVNSNVGKTANEILYSQPAVRKRNLTILPCDDGNFYPNYNVLLTSSLRVFDPAAKNYSVFNQDPSTVFYVDDLENTLPGFINLNFRKKDFNLVFSGSWSTEIVYTWDASSLTFSAKKPTGQVYNGSTQLNALRNFINQGKDVANNLFIAQSKMKLSSSLETQDISSNQVTFFDISNLFYGMRILPGSFTITDSAVTGSGGAISITIKDDGNGTLYRADSLTTHCTWNSVGTIFYNEGIIAIKSPHLYFFGQDQYEMSFKGEQNLHVLRLETLAPQNYLNSSSNPSFMPVASTARPNEPDPNFVYITGINYHDDNLNVVMKTQLAQPMMKRHSEKLLFRIKFDF